MALGVYITYKILDFPDLSVDGTFPLGAAVTVMLILKGVNPFLTLFLAFLTGAFAGYITGIIHVKFKVRDLLSGIIVMTALYSLNLRIAGKANVPIFSQETIFENAWLESMVPEALEPYLVASRSVSEHALRIFASGSGRQRCACHLSGKRQRYGKNPRSCDRKRICFPCRLCVLSAERLL